LWAPDSGVETTLEDGQGMPKKKTNKSAAKRFKRTAKGKVTYRKSGSGHLLSGKTRKRKRDLRRKGVLSDVEGRRVQPLLAG
jgi:large subunit ribosomal protein L35